MNDDTHLSPPQRDFRKYSLPLTSVHDLPAPSLTSPTSGAFANVLAWSSLNKIYGKKATHQDAPIKWTVNDEEGHEIRSSSFDSLSPMEDFIDEQCLHFEENFVNLHSLDSFLDDFDRFNERFSQKLRDTDDDSCFLRQSSTDTVINNASICKKCGHDILKL